MLVVKSGIIDSSKQLLDIVGITQAMESCVAMQFQFAKLLSSKSLKHMIILSA